MFISIERMLSLLVAFSHMTFGTHPPSGMSVTSSVLSSSVTEVYTVAGSTKYGFKDGRGGGASFNEPMGLDFSKDGGIIVADYGNHCLRKLTFADSGPVYVSTFAGKPGSYGFQDGDNGTALFSNPIALATAPDGTIYVADQSNRRIRAVRELV